MQVHACVFSSLMNHLGNSSMHLVHEARAPVETGLMQNEVKGTAQTIFTTPDRFDTRSVTTMSP
jgi:hypothetical protein